MKTLEKDKILKAIEECDNFKNEKGHKKFTPPYQFLLKCGWDKASYDEYLMKYSAGVLEGQEKEIFELIYLRIQLILSEIESMTIKGYIFPAVCKSMLETWAPNAYGTGKVKSTAQDNMEKYKRVKNLQNNSPLRFEEDDTKGL